MEFVIHSVIKRGADNVYTIEYTVYTQITNSSRVG
jgi:hypothetical protein